MIRDPFPPGSYKVDPATNCWVWQGPTDGRGYGLWHVGGKRRLAHVWALKWNSPTWPAKLGTKYKLVVRHLCNRSICCNPSHLRLGTPKENSKDMKDARIHTLGVKPSVFENTDQPIRSGYIFAQPTQPKEPT